jgi:RNA polymerase primary sigma factor
MATVTDTAQAAGQSDASTMTPLYGQIAKVKLLTVEQERDLAQRIERGDLAAKTHMIEANLRLVATIAKGFAGLGLPGPDLFQEGVIGLIRATEKFDYRRGHKFSTYASLWIREAIQRGLRRGRVVYLPADAWRAASRIRRSRAALIQRLGREPDSQEIASDLGLADDQVKTVTQALRDSLSLDAAIPGAGRTGLGETLLDENSPTPDREGEAAALKELVSNGLNMLDPQARDVIELRFGVGQSREACTVTESAQRLRISRPELRAIEHSALARLRQQRPIAAWALPAGPERAHLPDAAA